MNEPNIALTGDEARILMATLAQSPVTVPTSITIRLYMRLSQISQVQPPTEVKQ